MRSAKTDYFLNSTKTFGLRSIFELFLLLSVLMFQSNFALMQGVAWVGMLSNYSQNDVTLSEAVSQVLNGEDPCGLCLVIQEEQNSNNKASDSIPTKEDKKERKIELKVQNKIGIAIKMTVEIDAETYSRNLERLKNQVVLDIPHAPPRQTV